MEKKPDNSSFYVCYHWVFLIKGKADLGKFIRGGRVTVTPFYPFYVKLMKLNNFVFNTCSCKAVPVLVTMCVPHNGLYFVSE